MRLAVFAHLAPLAARPAKHPRSTSIRRSMAVRLSSERILPIIAATVVLGASLVSFQPAAAAGSTGSVDGPGTAPRIAIGGTGDQLDPIEMTAGLGTSRSVSDQADLGAPPVANYADDGTLYKPVAVNTVVADGSGLLQTYTVKSGDSLWSIANKNKLTYQELATANNLKSNAALQPGQKLIIPGKAPVRAAATAAEAAPGKPADATKSAGPALKHTVKSGETLGAIAQKYGVKQRDLAIANNITDPLKLAAGKELVIPGWDAASGKSSGKSPAKSAGSANAASKSAAESKPLFTTPQLDQPPVITAQPTTPPPGEVPVIRVDETPAPKKP